MGGRGKTELAKRAADRAAGRFEDGVLWADCGKQALGVIADGWAGAYGAQLAGDDEASRVAARRNLGCQKAALLILDDVQVEQGVEGLIPPRARCTVLVTTRHGAHPMLRRAARLELKTFSAAASSALADEALGPGTAAALA